MSTRPIALGTMLLLNVAFSTYAFGDEPPASELLPQPKQASPEQAVAGDQAVSPSYYRTSRYDVWQYYAVDRFGHFRPRVVLSPYGAYYLYNGRPFPWVSTHMAEVTATVTAPAQLMPYAEE